MFLQRGIVQTQTVLLEQSHATVAHWPASTRCCHSHQVYSLCGMLPQQTSCRVLLQSAAQQSAALQDLNHLRKAISKKADRETVEADLDRIHKALRCKANVHAMSEALSQKLDIHSFLTASASATKIPAFDPSSEPKPEAGATKEGRAGLTSRPSSSKQSLRHAVSARP